MEKNWLIRTVQKQILGPISKEKVIEFVEKGALKKEDQICSGNGFWFRIEEEELLAKYLFGNEKQPFNPVSEAQTKLDTANDDQRSQTQVIDLEGLNLETPEEAVALPEQNDLEYPENREDPEKVAPKNVKYPSSSDLQYPDQLIKQPTGCNELELSPEDDVTIELDSKKNQ